jgi:hypothetical protein
MATRVYITGSRIIVSKVGGDSLSIPQYRCKRTYIGKRSSQSVGTAVYTKVSISDIILGTSITDEITEIQGQTGGSIGDYAAVEAYLSGFIFKADTTLLDDELSTKANQETIISQNEEIKEDLTTLNLTQEDTQDLIKKELKENNKYLRKIYE